MTLTAIFIKRAHGGRMDACLAAVLEPGRGLVGNADRGGRRQVTLLSEERWSELMQEVGASLGPEATARKPDHLGHRPREHSRASSAHRFVPSTVGGETRPCEQMEAAAPGLQQAMRERWGGGAFAEVLDGGPVSVGDAVSWEGETE